MTATTTTSSIDKATLDLWSAPYRNWHYWPDHVIPAEPNVPGHEDFKNTDVPCVYQLPGQTGIWYMSFIAFNGKGYNSFVAQSTDLVHWSQPRLAMGFGKEGQFDFGGCVIGAFLYDSYDIKAPRVLKKRNGTFWTLYGCYAKQGSYEIDPGYEGVASSDDGLAWKRAKDSYILSVHEPEVGEWEKHCIYQPWLVEHEDTYYNFYNAKQMPDWIEQMGMATSTDILNWKRHKDNPVVRVRPGGYDDKFCSDAKVFRDGDHWVMFYFGVGKDGAHIMAAFSRDLFNWTAHPEPLYKAGGHPGGLDKQYAHKTSLVYNQANDTFYLYYCACGDKGRGIGLITSKPLTTGPEAGSTAETKKGKQWSVAPDSTLPNVLILGDSISIGYTLEVRSLLAGKANVFRPLSHDGKGPENCAGTMYGVQHIDEWLGTTQWAVIHFNWGLHDLKHVSAKNGANSDNPADPVQARVSDYSKNMEEIVGKLKATRAHLIFATTTPVVPGTTSPLRAPEAPGTYNATALKIMEAHGIAVDDLYSLVLPHVEKLQMPKNVHFTPAGSSFLAAQVARTIEAALPGKKLKPTIPDGKKGKKQ